MTTASARSRRPAGTAPWLRRLLRTRADRTQTLWSTLLVLATMVACAWIAASDFAAPTGEAASAETALVSSPRN